MVTEQFTELVNNICSAWLPTRIMEKSPTKLVVQCENGTFLVLRFIEPSGIPEVDSLMANRWMIQYTTKLEDSPYHNITAEAMGQRTTTNSKINEALTELATRVSIARALFAS